MTNCPICDDEPKPADPFKSTTQWPHGAIVEPPARRRYLIDRAVRNAFPGTRLTWVVDTFGPIWDSDVADRVIGGKVRAEFHRLEQGLEH